MSNMGLTIIHEPGTSAGENHNNVSIDLVFVHGLGGHPISTWSKQGSGTNWVTDFLPKDPFFEYTRILSFGYNSHFREARAARNVPKFARDLLRELHYRHKASGVSPIILLLSNHDLGAFDVAPRRA
jgi:hypothetical protein